MVLLGSFSVKAQYYFKDIISNQQLQADLANYKTNNIKSITVESFESDGSPSKGFIFKKKLNKNFTKSELMSRSDISGTSLVTASYDGNGRILSNTDSSHLSLNKIFYYYQPDGQIKSIKTTIQSADDDFLTLVTEEHIYEYNGEGKPLYMLRIMNHNDTSKVLFALDEMQNVAIEKDSKSGGKYYYYYDGKNRLTQIAEVNEFRQDPTPNYIFLYNNSGHISQMTVVQEGGSVPDYLVWKYGYENGLRSYEKLYTKERKLLGSVTYVYK
jgi:membrane-bound inhibitor of C-type lysozyme